MMCPRQAWLMSRNISGNQYNDFLAIGRLFSEESFKRSKKEVYIDGNIIDVVRKEKNSIVLIETKKTSRFIESAKIQLLYYLYNVKKKNNRLKLKAEIHVPKEKKIVDVELTKKEKDRLKQIIEDTKNTINRVLPECPTNKKYCKSCSYQEFCWS